MSKGKEDFIAIHQLTIKKGLSSISYAELDVRTDSALPVTRSLSFGDAANTIECEILRAGSCSKWFHFGSI